MQETQEMQFQSLGLKDPLEESMATHSSILAEKFYRLRSLAGASPRVCKRVGHDLETKQ